MASRRKKDPAIYRLIGAIAGLNLGIGLFADEASALKGFAFGTGILLIICVYLLKKDTDKGQ